MLRPPLNAGAKRRLEVAEKMKKYIVQTNIKHNGMLYAPGEEIMLTDEEAEKIKTFLRSKGKSS